MSKISLKTFSSFGDVAAEDDSVLDYFLKTDAVTKIKEHGAFLILGRKGSGKTALVKYFDASKGNYLSKSLSLNGYPWKLHSSRIDYGASDIEAYVSSWRYLICLELAILAIANAKGKKTKAAKAIVSFLEKNYGGIDPDLSDLLKPSEINISETTLEPEAFGFKLGAVSFERGEKDLNLGTELKVISDALLSAALEVASHEKMESLFLHFDELDQGLTVFDEERQKLLAGLILAAREIYRNKNEHNIHLNPVIYLRTDLWEDLSFSDKNKITQTSTLNLEWNEESLKQLIEERLKARLGKLATWQSISTDSLMRGSQPKWKHIVSRSFLRPRDVIKYLNSALSELKRRNNEPFVLDNEDITGARESFSTYLKQELDDEIKAHWPYWEEALQACSALSTITFDRDEFFKNMRVEDLRKIKLPEVKLYNYCIAFQ